MGGSSWRMNTYIVAHRHKTGGHINIAYKPTHPAIYVMT